MREKLTSGLAVLRITGGGQTAMNGQGETARAMGQSNCDISTIGAG